MGFRDEFKLSLFKLDHDKARDFAESPLIPWTVLAIYRGIKSLYCIGWIIYSGFYPPNAQGRWFIYLTHWGYACVTLYSIVSFVVTLCYHIKEKDQYDMQPVESTSTGTTSNLPDNTNRDGAGNDFNVGAPPNGHHKSMWVIYEIGASLAVVITLVYWSFLSGGSLTGWYLALDINIHAINTLFMVLEVAITSIPIRVLHVIYPVSFVCVYLIFTVIYWAAGGTDAYNDRFVYPILDYGDKPGLAAGSCFGFAFVAVPLVHIFIVYGLYRLRMFIANKCGRERVNTTQPISTNTTYQQAVA